MKDLERDFEEMVRKNRGTIYTVCYMFSNDQDEVADFFQEVLINLWKSLPSFDGRSDVRPWIYRVSLNVCISLDRRKRRYKTVPLTMDINPFEETETNRNSRQMDMLRQRIAKLRQYDRTIILLWLENMSYEEIAAIMNIDFIQVRESSSLSTLNHNQSTISVIHLHGLKDGEDETCTTPRQ